MNRLKDLRVEKRLSLRELSEKVFINYASLSRIENEKRKMHKDEIYILTSFFNVSSDYLLGYSTERVTPNVTKHHIGNETITEIHDVADTLTEDQARQILAILKAYLKEEKND